MGSALARGILSKKVLPFNSIYVSDTDTAKTRALHKRFGIFVSPNDEIATKCQYIIVAVKPQDSKRLFESISKVLGSGKHLISIMAGVTIKKIESFVGKKIAITRAMPNMAALAAKGMTCLSHNKLVRDKSAVQRIFSSVGDVIEIDEKKMDAVTAVSGSGPAYFFYLVECLADAAVKLGIKKDKATKLAVATAVGSGALLSFLDESPEALREKITSRKGTTEAGLRVLKCQGFKKTVCLAAKAAQRRSKELSKGA